MQIKMYFLYALLYNAVSNSNYTATNGKMTMNNELERICKEASWLIKVQSQDLPGQIAHNNEPQ
jgi:hypothetical protein